MPGFRTDLAMEAFDGAGNASLDGVRVDRQADGPVMLTQVDITGKDAASLLEKPLGRYITLECQALRHGDSEARLSMATALSEALCRLLGDLGDDDAVLVIGLGNRSITPDALGPAVVDRTLVTRHLKDRLSPAPAMRPVSAIAPGVLGVTGIETMSLAESLVRLVRPAAVICIDSLAARDSHRIGTTIQLTNTGIQPGAGVGNHRRALTRDSVGAPVIAIGMPTVIYAAALARDAFDWLNRAGGDKADHDEALQDMEQALLGGEIGEMIVTPREIDAMIQDTAGIIASALNRALQPGLSEEEIAAMSS